MTDPTPPATDDASGAERSRRPRAASPDTAPDVVTHPVWLAALRAMARIVDVMIILVIVGGSARALGATSGRSAVLTAVVFNVLLVAYWVAAEAVTGSTVGKRLFRLRVTDQRGEHPSLSASLGRNIAPALAVVSNVLGLLLAVGIGVSIVTGRGRGLHDRVMGTQVAVTRR